VKYRFIYEDVHIGVYLRYNEIAYWERVKNEVYHFSNYKLSLSLGALDSLRSQAIDTFHPRPQ
jgi:hypothetical protein